MTPTKLTTLQAAALTTLGAGFIGVALFLGGFDPKTGAPDPITVEEKTIEFTWTDDNTGEDLEIWTDKQTYTDGFSAATVYAAVKNNSTKEQDISLMGYFVNQRRYVENIAVLTEVTYPGADVYETVCKDGVATTSDKSKTTEIVKPPQICEDVFKQKGPDIVKLEWVNLPQMPRDLFEVSKEDTYLAKEAKVKKETSGYIAESKSFDFPIKPGQVVYYKIDIQYPANDDGNFFLEAIGSEGAYGHLDPWFSGSWTYRVSITVDDAQVPSTQTSFPVYVDLSDLPAGFHTNVKTDGCDIRVVESDETTETAFELVNYDSTTDTGELHFMADSLTGSGGGDTTFYIYYGNAAASCYAVTDTYGRNAVWSDYELVMHMRESSGSPIDSTGNYSPTYNGSLPNKSTSLPMGGGQDLDGVGDYVEVPSALFAGVVTAASYQLWLNVDTLAVGDNSIPALMGEMNTTSNNTRNFWLLDTAGKEYFDQFTPSGGFAVTTNSEVSISTTYLLHLTKSGNTVAFYKNGSHIEDKTTTESYTGTVPTMFWVAARSITGSGPQDEINGRIGSVRVRSTVLSANWIDAEYTNQFTPSTFYAVGAQETDVVPRRIINIQ